MRWSKRGGLRTEKGATDAYEDLGIILPKLVRLGVYLSRLEKGRISVGRTFAISTSTLEPDLID